MHVSCASQELFSHPARGEPISGLVVSRPWSSNISFPALLTPDSSRGIENFSGSSSARGRLRFHSAEGGERLNVRLRFRAQDTFVRRTEPAGAAADARLSAGSTSLLSPPPSTAVPAPAPLLVADGTSLAARTDDLRLRASSRSVLREDGESGTTTLVQRDRLDLRLRSAQIAVGDGAAISDSLEGQLDILERVFDAAGLLGDFNPDLADEFLARVREGLEAAGAGDGVGIQASSLDLKIRVRSQTVRVESADGAVVERSVQRIDIRVRFVALSVSGEVEEPREPVQADVEGDRGRLQGLGPLRAFDFNGDGRFSFDDVAALADEVIDL